MLTGKAPLGHSCRNTFLSAGSKKRDTTESVPRKTNGEIFLSTGGLGLKGQSPLCKTKAALYVRVGCLYVPKWVLARATALWFSVLVGYRDPAFTS